MLVKLRELLFFRQNFKIGRARAAVNKSQDRASLMLAEHQRTMEEFQAKVSEYNEAKRRLDTEIDIVQRQSAQYESTIEELREKNQVLQSTIDSLVASHKLLLSRYEAEIAIETRRRMSQTITTGD